MPAEVEQVTEARLVDGVDALIGLEGLGGAVGALCRRTTLGVAVVVEDTVDTAEETVDNAVREAWDW